MHTVTCNLACTDLLMNPDRAPKGSLTYTVRSNPPAKSGREYSFSSQL